MMYTSVTVFTLATMVLGQAPVAPPATAPAQASYADGLQVTEKTKKPMAVFIGSGANGMQQTVTEGAFDAALSKALADKYVVVYLNADNAKDQSLIKAFNIKAGNGVIISDTTGALMAFHQDGKIARASLLANLERFADPTVPVRTTISNTVSRTSFYPDGGATTGGSTFVPGTTAVPFVCPNCRR